MSVSTLFCEFPPRPAQVAIYFSWMRCTKTTAFGSHIWSMCCIETFCRIFSATNHTFWDFES